MPCMKDYGKTWDYQRGCYPHVRMVLVTRDGYSKFEMKEMPPPEFCKVIVGTHTFGIDERRIRFVREDG